MLKSVKIQKVEKIIEFTDFFKLNELFLKFFDYSIIILDMKLKKPMANTMGFFFCQYRTAWL